MGGNSDIKKWGAVKNPVSSSSSQRRIQRQFWPAGAQTALSKRDTQASQDKGAGNVKVTFLNKCLLG